MTYIDVFRCIELENHVKKIEFSSRKKVSSVTMKWLIQGFGGKMVQLDGEKRAQVRIHRARDFFAALYGRSVVFNSCWWQVLVVVAHPLERLSWVGPGAAHGPPPAIA